MNLAAPSPVEISRSRRSGSTVYHVHNAPRATGEWRKEYGMIWHLIDNLPDPRWEVQASMKSTMQGVIALHVTRADRANFAACTFFAHEGAGSERDEQGAFDTRPAVMDALLRRLNPSAINKVLGLPIAT